jgi:phosphohistidine phosphatase SixA
LGLKIKSFVDSNSLIITSEATRAIQTSNLISLTSGLKIISDARLYAGLAGDYLGVIGDNTQATTIILVGHNPAITAVAFSLSGSTTVFHPGTCLMLAGNISSDSISEKMTITSVIQPEIL